MALKTAGALAELEAALDPLEAAQDPLEALGSAVAAVALEATFSQLL